MGDYVVRPADLLSVIAARSGVTVGELASLNGLGRRASRRGSHRPSAAGSRTKHERVEHGPTAVRNLLVCFQSG
jgi:hypothetical protein